MSKSSKNHTNLVLQDQTNEIKNRHKQRHEMYEIEHEFKARRAKGLLSHVITKPKSQQSIPQVLILERRGRNRERGEGRLPVLDAGKEKGRRWLSTSPKYPTSSNTRRTKLPLDKKN